MACYELLWKKSAEKDLRKIDQQQIRRLVREVELLAKNPFASQYRKLRDTEHIYRIRVGDYRIIYEVDTKDKVVTIYYIRHRKEAYRRQ